MAWLSALFFVVGFALAYWFWIRPLLKARPQFADFYAATDSFWAAVRGKFNSIKTKFAAVLLMVASGLIETHDFLLPAATGLDWTPITQRLPPWAWPILSLGIGALFFWLRKLTAQSHETEVTALEEGATRQQAAVIAEKEPG